MSALPTIDRYAVEAEIGSGGFGAVYRARHVVLDRKVALKVLHPQRAGNTEVLQRFLREARAVAQLGSPHVVQVLDADVTPDGRAFIAMELLEGEDLAHRLSRGRMATHEVLRIGREVLAALVVAHAGGVVHRDLKPGNVFLARGASGETVAKVLDFGISKVRTESPTDELTRTGTLLGTPQYMAPEQFRSSRDVDARADLYALGVLLYEALAGRPPVEATSLHQLIAAKLTEVPPPLAQVAPSVPQAVAEVVMRALAVEPEHRFQSAAEMDAAIAAVESRVSAPGVSLRPAPRSLPPATPPAPTRSRAVFWIAGLAGLALVGAFALLAATALGLYVARDRLRDAFDEPTPPAPVPAAPVPAAPVPAMPAPVPSAPVPAAPVPSAPVPSPAPSLPPAPAPATEVSGVRVVPTAMGLVEADGVRALGLRARPALAGCRGARAYHEQIQFVVALGGALMPSDPPSTEPQHACVVDALRDAGPVQTVASGIARYDVTLDPR